MKICSNVEIRSNRAVDRHINLCGLGTTDQIGQQTRLEKMPLLGLVLAARPVEMCSKSWFVIRDS
jgi:hypothetical protein